MSRQRILVIGLVLLLSLAVSAPAVAQGASDGDGWDWLIAPLYLWAMDINGTQGFGTGTIDLDMKFEDIYPDLRPSSLSISRE